MHNISVFGTSSDAGKSTLTFIIAKALCKRGINTTVFKAQNVSNNSHVADDGSEIAISTYFQSQVIGCVTSWHQNPVLLKSGSKRSVSLIVRGAECDQMGIKEYYKNLDSLKSAVEEGFLYLDRKYDTVVAEGAGGCVELNLLEKDLSNTFIADRFDTKIILVADIEKGGVFASIYGTISLLEKKFKKNLIGVIINKFRGDRSLFDDGVKIIEKKFGVKVLGVLPYKTLNLGFEDSASLFNYKQKKDAKIRVGIIHFPHMSNFNDFEPLILDDEVQADFIKGGVEGYDLIILPGSKRVVEDLLWMKKSSLFNDLKRYKKKIIGICGGYEMMFEKILDPLSVESDRKSVFALGFINGAVEFKKEKILKKGVYDMDSLRLHGYEIHFGVSMEHPLYFSNERYFGTFLHAVFENDDFRKKIFKAIDERYEGYFFKEKREGVISEFCDEMIEYLDIDEVVRCISN